MSCEAKEEVKEVDVEIVSMRHRNRCWGYVLYARHPCLLCMHWALRFCSRRNSDSFAEKQAEAAEKLLGLANPSCIFHVLWWKKSRPLCK